MVELSYAFSEYERLTQRALPLHTYSMKGCRREQYILYLALLAGAIFALETQFAGTMGLVGSVSTVTIFGVVYFAFDRWAWRWPLLSKIAGIPNLEGTWQVTGQTNGADGIAREWSGKAEIVQTWSQIAISIETETSRSRSGMAAVECDPGHGFRVLYGYENEPKCTTTELYSHRGTCQVVFADDLQSGEATYFNDHQRRTCGTMTWKRTV